MLWQLLLWHEKRAGGRDLCHKELIAILIFRVSGFNLDDVPVNLSFRHVYIKF